METRPDHPAIVVHRPPRLRPPVVLFTIIGLNVLVFLAWWVGLQAREGLAEFLWVHFTTNWPRLAAGYWWTLLTSVFSHEQLWHLLINMLVLASFGRVLEHFWGPWRFLAFYLGAGVTASLVHCVLGLLGWPETPALGASGAVTAVVMVFSMMLPRQKLLLFGVIPMPAWLAVGLFVGVDLVGLAFQYGGGGLPIGHGAHLGGAAFGLVYFLVAVRPHWRRPPRPRPPIPATNPPLGPEPREYAATSSVEGVGPDDPMAPGGRG